MRIKKLPVTCWSIDAYHPDLYSYGQIDVFIDDEQCIGERVICIFRSKDLIKYDNNKCYDTTLAILCNDCGVHSGIYDLYGLNAGQIIPVQFNGPNLPTIPADWMRLKFWLIP